MTAAEESAKQSTVAPAKGAIQVEGPNETKIWVRPPRGKGPWFRVKHPIYGHRLIKAKDDKEALRKYFQEFVPAFATDDNWIAESMKANNGRCAKAYD